MHDIAATLTAILNGQHVPGLDKELHRAGLTWSYWRRGSDECALIEAANAVNSENKGMNPHTVYRTDRIYTTIDAAREECRRTITEGVLRLIDTEPS